MSEAPAARLHSRYKPLAEAERYIDALAIPGGIAYFILIEPGLGYLATVLRNRFKNSTIIVLHADSRFRAAGLPAGVPAWYPDSGEPVRRFLEREIPDLAASSVRVIEWRPSIRVYGERCLSLLAETAAYIKRADAAFRTVAAFGGKWVAAFFRNLGLVRRALRFEPLEVPVIVTGSGPGLEAALPRIRALRDRAFVLAASSSLLALRAGGVVPDMAISTDGGSWALCHLYSCFRGRGPGLLAASLSAALPSHCADLPVLVLNNGSLWQSLVLRELGIPSVLVPERGTVTASALELALVLSSGPVYLAGLDLAVRDIRTHARPYGFDHLFFGAASRLRPVYSQYFARSFNTQQGGSLAVYADWFKNQLALWPRRIFSLGGNHAVFGDDLPSAWNGPDSKNPHCAAHCFTPVSVPGTPGENCRRGAAALCRALEDPRYANTLREELAPLLFPGIPAASNREIAEKIRGMAAKYGGKTGG